MGGAGRCPRSGEVSDLSPSGRSRRDRRHYDRPPQGLNLCQETVEGRRPDGDRGRRGEAPAGRREENRRGGRSVSAPKFRGVTARHSPGARHPLITRGMFFEGFIARSHSPAGTRVGIPSASTARSGGRGEDGAWCEAPAHLRHIPSLHFSPPPTICTGFQICSALRQLPPLGLPQVKSTRTRIRRPKRMIAGQNDAFPALHEKRKWAIWLPVP